MPRSATLSDKYLRLAGTASLKRLEQPYAYRKDTDELYELSEEAFNFLLDCDGTRTHRQLKAEPEFLEYCMAEGLVEGLEAPGKLAPRVGRCEERSLRYLVVDVTNRCNLACRHCYLGTENALDLDLGLFERVLEEFESMGGLRLIVSGGEPLLAPKFERINDAVRGRAFRSILSSNGTRLEGVAARPQFDAVQVSLDGMKEGHELLRGAGSFERAVKGMESVAASDAELVVATMIHAGNVGEFDEMARMISELEATAWTIDVPVPAGRLAAHPELLPSIPEALDCLAYQFGGEMHGSAAGEACGAHLASVLADGTFAKCAFYGDWTGGNAADGLLAAWRSLERIRIQELKCDCDALDECRGGCRFRAEILSGDRLGPDPVKCAIYGVEPDGYEGAEDLGK